MKWKIDLTWQQGGGRGGGDCPFVMLDEHDSKLQ